MKILKKLKPEERWHYKNTVGTGIYKKIRKNFWTIIHRKDEE